MTVTKRTILVLLLCLPSIALAQAPPGPPSATPYVLFIHSGPKSADDPEVKRIAVSLAKAGYSVREPQNDQDKVGGPGVDYFAPQAANEAAKVAGLVSGYLGLDASKKLPTRRQSGKSPPNYLGVWLY
ncbi:MAG TPA: hypothetical protein VN838_26010 [Bradyrhizobium sp.]|nr:hypothetical protein [Bradyrhizobium sp.]